jgi:hypothetical protein
MATQIRGPQNIQNTKLTGVRGYNLDHESGILTAFLELESAIRACSKFS